MPFRLEVVTAERAVYSEDVDLVTVPGIDGELGILPHHAPLLTALSYGELLIRKGGEETSIAIGGGFLEVRPDKVVVLADMAERAEEIDLSRAEAARQQAQERIAVHPMEADLLRAEAALRQAETRLRVARRRRGTGAPTVEPGAGSGRAG